MVIIKQVHFSVTHARTHERTPTWWYACPAKVPSSGGYPGCSIRGTTEPEIEKHCCSGDSLQRSVSKYLLEYRVIPYSHTVHT